MHSYCFTWIPTYYTIYSYYYSYCFTFKMYYIPICLGLFSIHPYMICYSLYAIDIYNISYYT